MFANAKYLRPASRALVCAIFLTAFFFSPGASAATVVPAEAVPAAAPSVPGTESHSLSALYEDAAPFERAMQAAEAVTPAAERVTGMLVPHGPQAFPFIARVFAGAAKQEYDLIIVLAETDDESGSLAVLPPSSLQNLQSCFGPVPFASNTADALEKALPLPQPKQKKKSPQVQSNAPAPLPRAGRSPEVAASAQVQSLLPFIARHFPKAGVLPLGVRRSATVKELEALASAVSPLAKGKALVVLSANSLAGGDADQGKGRDLQTMRVLASANPKLACKLAEPGNLDAPRALFVQMSLQSERNSPATVLDNAALGDSANAIPALYASRHLPVTGGVARYFFGGDFFTGRNLVAFFENPVRRELMVKRILERTEGCPLLVNFEGVLMNPDSGDPKSRGGKAPLPQGGMRLWMPWEPTLQLMKELNIIGVSIANNHTYDFGNQAYADMQTALEAAGFPAAGQGEIREFPHFVMAAATDLDNNRAPFMPILEESDLAPLAERNKDKPLFTMMHCGHEYWYQPSDRVKQLAKIMEKHGSEVFIGHHTHRHGPFDASPESFRSWSLGNFVFDQVKTETDGALMEIIFFSKGTYWVRQHPAENMYRDFYRK